MANWSRRANFHTQLARRYTGGLRWLLVFCTAFILGSVAFPASNASAHAKLLRSAPGAGAILNTPPTAIRLDFSESVALDFSTLQVYNGDRQEQEVGAFQAANSNGTSISADLPAQLAAGTYTVVWRVISAIDGHLTVGTFAFRVRGEGGTPEPEGAPVPLAGFGDAPVEGSAESSGPLRWPLRGLILACAALLTGGALFSVLVMEPTVEERAGNAPAIWSAAGTRFARIGWVAGVVLIVGLLTDLIIEVAAIGGTSFFEAFGSGDLAVTLVTGTRFGFAWSMKVIAAATLLLLYALLANLRKRDATRTGAGMWEICIAAGSFLLLAESLSSHSAGVTTQEFAGLPVPVISIWLHLVTAAVWVGGIAYLVLALFPTFRRLKVTSEERRAFLGKSVPRFSRLALASVVTLAATGTYNLIIHSTDLAAILSSSYGQVLTIKVLLFIILVGIGAVNLLRLSPRLRAKPEGPEQMESSEEEVRPVRMLRRNVRTELAVLSVVLVLAGALTLLPPPAGAGNTYAFAGDDMGQAPGAITPEATQAPDQPPQAAIATVDVAGYNFVLETLPSTEGDRLTLTVTQALSDATPLDDVSRVLFRVTPQDLEAGTTSYEAEEVEAIATDLTAWQIREQLLTLEGGYLVNVVLQRTESDDLRAAFRLDFSLEQGLKATAAEAYRVAVDTDPSPPVVGANAVRLTLQDASGEPVEGARITVAPRQPTSAEAMVGGEATPVAGEPGVYSLPISFDASGPWVLFFTVVRGDGPPYKLDASIDVSSE